VLVVEVSTEISITKETELELSSHFGDIVGSDMSLEYEAVVLGVLDISKEVFKKQYASWPSCITHTDESVIFNCETSVTRIFALPFNMVSCNTAAMDGGTLH
jgi:hypothetical protein